MKPVGTYVMVPDSLVTSRLSISEKIVWIALAHFANETGECWPSIATVAKYAGVSDRTVQRAMTSLVKKSWVTNSHRSDVKSTIYRIKIPHGCQNVTGDTLSPPPVTECHPPGDTLSPELISIELDPFEPVKSSPHSKDSIDLQGVQDAWTSICVPAGLHAVRDWSVWNDRIKTAWRRIADSKDAAWSSLSPLERFKDLFTHASKTPFLTGGNDRKWKADLEFVLRPLSVDRIMSGFYDDKQSTIQRGLTDVHAWDDVKGW